MKPRSRPRAARLALNVQYAVAPRHLPDRAALRQWARAALEGDATITVRFVGRREGRALNRRFRGKDHATNVLTFVLRETPPYEADLVLCAPVVAEEAHAQGKSLSAHYAHLLVHGVLHLQGYDHDDERSATVMEAKESQIMARLGYPDPYANDERGTMSTRR